MRPETGERLGEYLLEEELAASEARSTYYAEAQSGPVVVKTFSLERSDGWKSAELFDRSVETLAGLEVEGVPEFIDAFDDEERGLRVLVREFVAGETIAERVEGGWHPTGERIRSLARDVLDILEELHGRNPPIIHRDIKPANIVLDAEQRPRLIDFGVVRTEPHREETHPGTVVGTYGYMAPEQFRGHAEPATDLYGLGATLLRVVAGREPAELPNDEFRIRFREHADLDEAMATWLERMIAPSLEERFETARRARRALDPDALRDTVEGEDSSAVAIADTVPDRAPKQSELREASADEYTVSPDVTAARIMESAPDGCRVEADVRRHCLEFRLPRSGLSNWTLVGLVALAGPLVWLFAAATPLLAIPFLLPIAVASFGGLYRGLCGQIVQVGKGFLQVKYQCLGTSYASSIRTEVDHVEIVETPIRSSRGKTLRIWSGVDDYLDVGSHLSPPELNWFQSLLTFCLDHPESVRRSEVFRRQLEAEPGAAR